ncbi:hypothetical protein KOW79_006318 [Hemibagrus wyckioides]|uniref:Lysosome-associated membrane glycoprotein 2-like luminal domain-containing protein n=1 Tax=Hemibagrus wyckioides TaxID=337641 RepID=A0A9D3SMD9_9TELE|nr:macrosialin [Hemibagrus wyckioides]KAG7330096.1 hypothetical protein KOW79_006318 [Hemibagrus wyckioides]
MRHGSARLIVAVLVLVTALTLAEEDAGFRNAPASMLPPVPFPDSTTSSTATTTTAQTPQNTTIANTTTVATTTHHTTTTNVTTTAPSPQNSTTANMTTVAPTTHNTTTANATTPNTTTKPTPKPEPTGTTNVTVGNYTVKVGNKLCVMVQASIKVHVNNSKQHMEGEYIVPGDVPSTGKCEGNTASLRITLKEGYISMDFTKNDTSDAVFVSAVAVNLTYAFKPGVWSQLDRKSNKVQLFSMKIGHSYSCKSELVLLGNDTSLEFNHERMQAFNLTNNQFGPLDLCKADQPDYRVAIGVGVVLLILIIIVVVAYLISRRKRTDGYQTL